MGAGIEGDGRLGGDRSDPPVVDVCLPPDGAYRGLRHRAANRLDHVKLTPGATALAMATDTLGILPDLVEASMTEMRLRSKMAASYLDTAERASI
jgi:hypothetical protein